MKTIFLLIFSIMLTMAFSLHVPIYAKTCGVYRPIPQTDNGGYYDEGVDDYAEDCDPCEPVAPYDPPCAPWAGWYCGMSYAVIGLGVAAVAAVTAIVLASGHSEVFH